MLDIRYGKRLIAPALVILVAAGCGGGGDAGAGADAGGEEAAAPAQHPVDAATAGSISGVINFEGQAPAMEAIDMSAEPACAEKWTESPMTQSVLVNDGKLANVFIHVTAGPTSDLDYPHVIEQPVLDQDGCRYRPHVLGVMAGQELIIRNSDGILHNINASPEENRGFNISQPVDMESTRSFPVSEVMIPLRCDVHGWMNAYLGILDHPNFAVSAEDGSFSMDRLPPGDYTLEAWHETFGVLTANVTVESGAAADVAITFSADMADNAVVPLGEPLDLHDHSARSRADLD